jgi:hypothetical protein
MHPPVTATVKYYSQWECIYKKSKKTDTSASKFQLRHLKLVQYLILSRN